MPDPHADARAAKARLRAETLARRDGMDPVARIEASLALADIAEPRLDLDPGTVVAGFLPIRSEVDLRPLLDRLRARGARLCLPAVIDRQTLHFRELTRTGGLVPTGFGTAGPPPEAARLEPDVMLVPLAAFDARGHRIGYGAGHYDRAIAALREAGRQPRLIGCAFAVQEVAAVPDEPHDVALDAVVTEAGWRDISGEGR